MREENIVRTTCTRYSQGRMINLKIIYEDIHVATQELNKVSICLEKSEKTNPYTLKKTQRFSQSFATSISEALHISFQPTETRLLFDYLKHLATKRDISGILFVGANNSTDFVAGLLGMVRNTLGGNNVLSIFEKSGSECHIIIGIKKDNESNDIMLAAKLFCH